MKTLIEELKRRRVPRTVAMYLAAAFAISQAVQLLEDALHLPNWFLTVTVLVGLAGVPVVTALAWHFDLGHTGIVRTPASPASGFRWSAGSIIGLMAAFGVIIMGGWLMLRSSRDDLVRVAVLPLQNRTGDRALDNVGEIAADWITESLVRAAVVEVIDVQTILAAMGGDSAAGVFNGSNLISGNYYRMGDSLVFNVRIVDETGRTVHALQPIASAADAPTHALTDLRDRVLAAVAWRIDRRISGFEQAGTAPSYPAYESYLEGLHAHLAGDYRTAAAAFRQAFDRDSTFLRALLWAAAASTVISRSASDSMFSVLARRSHELSPYDRHHALFYQAFLSNDNERAYTEAKAMMTLSPGSSNAIRETALSALRTGRIAEAIALLRRIGGVSSTRSEWWEYYTVLSGAYLRRGDLGKAMQIARQGWTTHRTPAAMAQMARVAAKQRNFAFAAAIGDSLGRLSEDAHVLTAANALYAAGARAEAVRLWRRTAQFATSSVTRAAALYCVGEYANALSVLDAISGPDKGSEHAAVLRGLIAARTGQPAHAQSILRSFKLPAWHGTYNYRARIFAALGQRDSAVANLSAVWYTNIDEDPDIVSLRGYAPFEDKLRIR